MANIIYSAYFCKPNGGSESYTALKWLNVLLLEHEVHLFTSMASHSGLIEMYGTLPANLKITSFDIPNWIEKRRKIQMHWGYFAYERKLINYLKKHNEVINWSDVILKKTPSSFRYYTRLYKFNKPFIIGPLGGGLQVPRELKSYFKNEPFFNKLRKLDKLLFFLPPFSSQLKNADKILVTLDYLKDILPVEYHNKIISILDTGIDLPSTEGVIRHDDGVLKLLYVGKLIRYKGCELLLRALISIGDRINFTLDIVGDGNERCFLEKMVEKSNIKTKVTFHGNLEKDDVMNFYKTSDIFCFPTLTEASGNVLLEAMAYEMPIITINNGGPKYMCPDDGAIKVEIGAIDVMINNIAQAITDLSFSSNKREQMGRRNRIFLEENFTWNVLTERINTLFHKYD